MQGPGDSSPPPGKGGISALLAAWLAGAARGLTHGGRQLALLLRRLDARIDVAARATAARLSGWVQGLGEPRVGRGDTGAMGARRRLRDWRPTGPTLPPGLPSLEAMWCAAAIAVVLAGVTWERCGWRGCPDPERLEAYQPGGAPVLLDRYGEPFAELHPLQRRVVPLDSLPEYVPAAFVAVEDHRFYGHNGIDWIRVVGAAARNLREASVLEGASTITMQLARNVFPERIPGTERTLRRKLLESRVAQEIEERFSKAEILELYLNHIYFGGAAYGIDAAARYWFNRRASKITLPQAALLAGMLKAPTHHDPRRHREAAEQRKDLVLARMVEQESLTAEEAEAARAAPLGVEVEPPPLDAATASPYFVAAVRRLLENRLGETLYGSRLRIHTTVDPLTQAAAEQELREQLESIERGTYGAFRGARFDPNGASGAAGTDYLQGAVVFLEAQSGDILALVGGRDFTHSRYDRATRGRRQLGSSFKPFVFTAALTEGFVASQPLADLPFRVEQRGSPDWEPSNYDGQYYGYLSMRESLVRSRNSPTARIALAVGPAADAATARLAGLAADMDATPALALGTASASPLQLATAYSVFSGAAQAGSAAGDDVWTGVAPRLIRRIDAESGRVLWQADISRRGRVDARVGFIITDILRDAVDHGTGTAVRSTGYYGPVAGKTGTTQGGNDAWFVGYTPELVGVVWIGFDRPRPILPRATGGTLAAPIWGRIMQRVQRERESIRGWPQPAGLSERWTDPETGLVLASGCYPRWGSAVRELFLVEYEPVETCPHDPRDRWWSDVVGLLGRSLGIWEDDPRASRPGDEAVYGPPRDETERLLGVRRLPLR